MTPRSRKAVEQRVYVTYWLTRDADPETGAPVARVDVWLSRPMRYPVGDRGWFWLDVTSATGLGDRDAVWSLETAASLGTYPDDAGQCVKVGP